MTNHRIRAWCIDGIIGVIGGGIVGAIVAVNIAVYAGPDQGYESSVGDVFEHSSIAGSAIVISLMVLPVVGVVITHRLRSRTHRSP